MDLMPDILAGYLLSVPEDGIEARNGIISFNIQLADCRNSSNESRSVYRHKSTSTLL